MPGKLMLCCFCQSFRPSSRPCVENRTEEPIKWLIGVLISFLLACNELIEISIDIDVVKFERHDCLVYQQRRV